MNVEQKLLIWEIGINLTGAFLFTICFIVVTTNLIYAWFKKVEKYFSKEQRLQRAFKWMYKEGKWVDSKATPISHPYIAKDKDGWWACFQEFPTMHERWRSGKGRQNLILPADNKKITREIPWQESLYKFEPDNK